MNVSIKPIVTPRPEIGDTVRIRLPGGAIGHGVLHGLLYATETRYECQLPDGKFVYVGAGDIERW